MISEAHAWTGSKKAQKAGHVTVVTANVNSAAGALPDSLQLAIGFKKTPGAAQQAFR